MSGGVRVVIADDHVALRAGIRRSLEADGFDVCGEASDGPGAVALAEAQRPAACLLDVHMPGGGVRAAGEIVERVPETVVVMLTVSRDDGDLFGALRAGASGYLLKDIDPDRLGHAVRGVLSGEAAVPRELMARVIDEFRTGGRSRRLPLAGGRGAEMTNREWEVLDLVAKQASTAEIAQQLGVSPVTVRRHVSAVLGKLEVADRAAAVRLVEAAEL